MSKRHSKNTLHVKQITRSSSARWLQITFEYDQEMLQSQTADRPMHREEETLNTDSQYTIKVKQHVLSSSTSKEHQAHHHKTITQHNLPHEQWETHPTMNQQQQQKNRLWTDSSGNY